MKLTTKTIKEVIYHISLQEVYANLLNYIQDDPHDFGRFDRDFILDHTIIDLLSNVMRHYPLAREEMIDDVDDDMKWYEYALVDAPIYGYVRRGGGDVGKLVSIILNTTIYKDNPLPTIIVYAWGDVLNKGTPLEVITFEK